MMDYTAMGKRIRKLRLLQNRTQANVAKECGLSSSFYGHIERGTRKASLETLLMISIVLDATTDFLLKGEEPIAHHSMEVLSATEVAKRAADVLVEHAREWLAEENRP